MLQKVFKLYQVIITDMNRHDDLIANDPLYMTALHVRCSALHLRYIFQYSFVMPSPSLSIITLPRPQNPNFTSFPHPGSTHRKILRVLKIAIMPLIAAVARERAKLVVVLVTHDVAISKVVFFMSIAVEFLNPAVVVD